MADGCMMCEYRVSHVVLIGRCPPALNQAWNHQQLTTPPVGVVHVASIHLSQLNHGRLWNGDNVINSYGICAARDCIL